MGQRVSKRIRQQLCMHCPRVLMQCHNPSKVEGAVSTELMCRDLSAFKHNGVQISVSFQGSYLLARMFLHGISAALDTGDRSLCSPRSSDVGPGWTTADSIVFRSCLNTYLSASVSLPHAASLSATSLSIRCRPLPTAHDTLRSGWTGDVVTMRLRDCWMWDDLSPRITHTLTALQTLHLSAGKISDDGAGLPFIAPYDASDPCMACLFFSRSAQRR